MKNYTVTFGSGDPRGFTGLAPTFLIFYNLSSGTTNAPPSISETVSGKTGIYTFSYGVTQPISFLIDAATTSPGTTGRYVSGQIDPSDRSDEYGTSLVALGNSCLAIGNFIGSTSSSFGSTSIDPSTVFGFLMRAQEMMEGNQVFTKSSGLLDFYSRGSSTLLREKTIVDSASTTTKT